MFIRSSGFQSRSIMALRRSRNLIPRMFSIWRKVDGSGLLSFEQGRLISNGDAGLDDPCVHATFFTNLSKICRIGHNAEFFHYLLLFWKCFEYY